MSLSETELQHMSYREVVELAKEKGVYQKKSAKKAALIRRLSTVWTNDECMGIENIDPNRTAPMTPLKEVDESLVAGSDYEDQERRLTFTKVKKAAKSKFPDPEVSIDPPQRQNTFTKSYTPDLSISKIEEEAATHNGTFTKTESEDVVESSQPRKVTRASKKKSQEKEPLAHPITRQNTFTKEEEPSNNVETKDVVDPPQPQKVKRPSKNSSSLEPPLAPLTRQNTFTKDEAENLDQTKSLVHEGTITKTPEKKESEIPVLQLNTAKTPPQIEKLSVFQRLSSTISLSQRRSLVSEKRVSVKTSFLTPQSDRRSKLNALREARKNHITPKSLSKVTRASAVATPVQPIIKSSATSTKKSSVKKPPNFAEIHKRNFAKMESLLEHKRRLRERAEFMSPARRTQMTSSIPKRVEGGITGLSKSSGKNSNIPVLLKKAATKDRLKLAMAKKCSTGAVMHEKDKKILKGVRMNKRFQLQLALKQKKA